MGRAARQKRGGSAVRQHWTETHPDRHLWSPGRLAMARTQTQEEYEALYGRENAGLDLSESSPAARKYVSDALRAFAAGKPDELLSIVRTYGLPEEGTFLEKTYKRAFSTHLKGVFRDQLGTSLLQRDPLMEKLYDQGRGQFYQDLLSAANGESSLESRLPDGWQAVLFQEGGETTELLRGDLAASPFSEANPELLRGLLQDSSAWPGALESSLRREVLRLTNEAIRGTGFWQSWDLAHSVINLNPDSNDIRILRAGSASPLLHLRDPDNRWETICGKDRLGHKAKRDSWAVAGESNQYKRCPDCESGLDQRQDPEADRLRVALKDRGEYLPLHKISESDQDALLAKIVEDPGVQSALRAFGEGGDQAAVSQAMLARLPQFMYQLEEMQRQSDDRGDDWSVWRRHIGYKQRNEMSSVDGKDLLKDDEAMKEIFTPTIRQAVWELDIRAQAASREGDSSRVRKIRKAISHICTHAAMRATEKRKQKPAQSEASVSQ